jgi:hypothetical protein
MWTGSRARPSVQWVLGVKLTTAPTYLNGMPRDSYFYFFSCLWNGICKVLSNKHLQEDAFEEV